MVIPYQLTREDYKEYLSVACANAQNLAGRSSANLGWNLAIYVPLFIAVTGFFIFVSEYAGPGVEFLYVAIGALLWFFVAILLWNWLGKKRYLTSMVLDDGWFLKPATLTLMPHGIETRADKLGFELPWSAILGMQHTSNLILLYFDGASALVIPKRAFSNQDQLADFIGVVESEITPADNSTAQLSW